MQQQPVEMQLPGADPQHHLHPLAAEVEHHRLWVAANGADEIVFHEAS